MARGLEIIELVAAAICARDFVMDVDGRLELVFAELDLAKRMSTQKHFTDSLPACAIAARCGRSAPLVVRLAARTGMFLASCIA